MEKIDLTRCVNCRFRAKVDGKEIEGRIAVYGDYLQFFYNYGNESCYSMLISYYREHGLDYFDDFEIVPRDPETYQDWQVGDLIGNTDGSTGRIIFRSGEFVAVDIDGCRCYTCEELFNDGYCLFLTDIEDQIIEEKEEKRYEPQDGDIVAWKEKDDDDKSAISIYREENRAYFTLFVTGMTGDLLYKLAMNIVRPATEDEKKMLFDAMAKKGKRWNAEKKVVEDIPKPYEFKKGEPVLVRDDSDMIWELMAFMGIERGFYYPYRAENGHCQNKYRHCIPYNERTMHLLGTSEDYKEGE